MITIDGEGLFTEIKDKVVDNYKTYLIWRLVKCDISEIKYLSLVENIKKIGLLK